MNLFMVVSFSYFAMTVFPFTTKLVFSSLLVTV